MHTIYYLIKHYNPRWVIIWCGEETIFEGIQDDLFSYVSKNVEWICYEYFKETGELIINV